MTVGRVGAPVARGVKTVRVDLGYSPLGNVFVPADRRDEEAACNAYEARTCSELWEAPALWELELVGEQQGHRGRVHKWDGRAAAAEFARLHAMSLSGPLRLDTRSFPRRSHADTLAALLTERREFGG